MFVKDEAKEKYLNEIFKQTDEKPDSKDLMSNIDVDLMEKLGIKFKNIEQIKV